MTKEEQTLKNKFRMLCSSSKSWYRFVLCFLVIHMNTFLVNGLSIDIMNATCRRCADMSTLFKYDFCVTSLQTVSLSHSTNLQGLALIAMELALANASSTVSTIEKMISGGSFDPSAKQGLSDCLELYADGISMLVNSIAAFLSEHYDATGLLVNMVMESTTACEEGFAANKRQVTPLTKENYNLFELTAIARCIINLILTSKELFKSRILQED